MPLLFLEMQFQFLFQQCKPVILTFEITREQIDLSIFIMNLGALAIIFYFRNYVYKLTFPEFIVLFAQEGKSFKCWFYRPPQHWLHRHIYLAAICFLFNFIPKDVRFKILQKFFSFFGRFILNVLEEAFFKWFLIQTNS